MEEKQAMHRSVLMSLQPVRQQQNPFFKSLRLLAFIVYFIYLIDCVLLWEARGLTVLKLILKIVLGVFCQLWNTFMLVLHKGKIFLSLVHWYNHSEDKKKVFWMWARSESWGDVSFPVWQSWVLLHLLQRSSPIVGKLLHAFWYHGKLYHWFIHHHIKNWSQTCGWLQTPPTCTIKCY